MRQFLIFVSLVFVGLFLAVINKNDETKGQDSKPVVRIFGYTGFTSKWGPGPQLKEQFEKECSCRIEFIEGSDSGVLLQRLRIEGESLGADLVIGLDQYDLGKALSEQKWKSVDISKINWEPSMKAALVNPAFVPFDWGVISFIARKGELPRFPASLDDLLSPDFAKQISLEDPRTSSPGKQFLYWVIRAKGVEEGFKYFEKLNEQVHSYSPSWSTAYGLFTKKQTKLALSYVTSPVYHQLEEKDMNYIALEFKEDHPIQVEYMGIPEFCKNCELAQAFINKMLSPEGQKIIMDRNYMLPVIQGVREGTAFAMVPRFKTIDKIETPSVSEVEDLLKRWSSVRRGEKN